VAFIQRRVRAGRDGEPGDVSYRVRYRGTDGKERSKSFKRKIDAERWAATQMASIAKGEWIDPQESRVTFGEWVPQWELTLHHLGPRTRQLNVGVAHNYLVPLFGARPLDSITRSDVQAMLGDELAAGELSNSAVRRHVMVLSQILQSAVEDGRLGRNVAKSIRLPPEQARSMRRLNETELQRLIAATPSFHRPMVMTAAFLGLRWGEITGLGVEHLDFDAATVRVERQMQDINGKMRFTQPKSKSGYRTVSAPESLMEVLAQHVKRRQVRESGLVFPGEAGRPLRGGAFRRVWLRAVEAADLQGFVFHELRHTAVALAIAQGAHPMAIKERLGHASITTTLDRYGGLFPSLDRDIANGLDATVRRATDSLAARPGLRSEIDFGL